MKEQKKPLYTKLLQRIKSEVVLCIAGAAALISMLFVPPSADYLSYLDFRVLALLFCLMTVVAGAGEIGLFLKLSDKLLKRCSHTRSLSLILVLLCFFTSMWITNDVALITFVPFAILLLTRAGQSRHLIHIIVLQTIAANLGSMLTPVGNPQNLYLYTYYKTSIRDFLLIMLPLTLLSLGLLLVTVVLAIRKEPLNIKRPESADSGNDLQPLKTGTAPEQIKRGRLLAILYGLLFLLCLLCVVRLIDYPVTLAIVLLGVLAFDFRILKKVDYSLLLTFVCFFLFVGNIGNLPAARDFLAGLLEGKELPVSVMVSQIISNVPAAVLLSSFTENGKALLLGTNLGGLGTLVASLASLISYKLYCRSEGAKPLRYLKVFTLYNVIFLAILYLLLVLIF